MTECARVMSDSVCEGGEGLSIIGASEAKPLSSGWCETGSFSTSRLHNRIVQ